MKIAIILSVLLLVVSSDFVSGRPAERQKRWDLFSRAREWFNDVGNHVSEASRRVGDLADKAAARAREHLNDAADHLENFGNKARDRLNQARDRLNQIA